MEAREVGWGS